MMSKINDKVSIVTVTYNCVDIVESTILSVLNQTYSYIEYIIIDGGSTDGTVDIIKKYANSLTYWISEKDKGIYDAMNKGIERATGQWIIFMNSGDRFYSVSTLMNIFQKHYEADIIYGDAMVEYPNFQTPWRKVDLSNMWKRTPFCHQACFTRTTLMKEYKFNLKFKLSSDFDFLYKIYLEGKKFLYIDGMICFYDYKYGATIKNEFLSLSERKQAVLSHGFEITKWIYYTRISLYIRTATFFKGIIGKKLTEWVTRFLKQ